MLDGMFGKGEWHDGGFLIHRAVETLVIKHSGTSKSVDEKAVLNHTFDSTI